MNGRTRNERRIVVGIAGGSAAGKTTAVERLTRQIEPVGVSVLRHDSYYHDLSHLPFERRIEVNVDHPDSLETSLLVAHVVALRSGVAVETPVYDFVSQTQGPTGVLVEPAPVIVVEGMLSLYDERLRELMDLRVFLDTTEADRLARRVSRDAIERGRDRAAVLDQHENRVQPMHELFVAPTRAHADVVIAGGGHNVAAISDLATRVVDLLAL